jgi:hypothetical protein
MEPITIAALTTLATQVVGILTSLFSKAGEAFASKIGEDAYEEGKHLYHVVWDRFAKEPDKGKASKALQNFADDPETYDTVLEKVLVSILQSDLEFAYTLESITQKGPIQRLEIGNSSIARDNQMRNTQGEGTQIAKAGENSTLEGNIFEIG